MEVTRPAYLACGARVAFGDREGVDDRIEADQFLRERFLARTEGAHGCGGHSGPHLALSPLLQHFGILASWN